MVWGGGVKSVGGVNRIDPTAFLFRVCFSICIFKFDTRKLLKLIIEFYWSTIFVVENRVAFNRRSCILQLSKFDFHVR